MEKVRIISSSASLPVLFKIPISFMYLIDAMKYRLHYIRRLIIVVFYYSFFSGNVLDSCDGRVISNNIFYVDFSLIKYQCSCSFTFAFNARLFYSLSRNPGYDDCGTAIRISDINGTISTMQCTSFIPSTFVSSQMTTVELSCVDSTKCGNAGYCLRIRSNSRYF